MVEVPEWERLADALKRVVASGVTEGEAKAAICNAIADRSVTVRLFVGNIEGADIFLLEGWERDVPPSRTPPNFALWESALTGRPPRQPSLMIPRHNVSSKRQHTPLIVPGDFDWQESRPLKPWRDPQGSFTFFDWHCDRLELCSADVTRVLIAPRSGVHGRPKKRSAKKIATAKRPKRKSPKREQAHIALNKIYPTGIPDENREPNPVIVDKVVAWVTKQHGNRFSVSKETILRAAGRVKERKGRSRHG
jgi:hypothetical protein